MLFISQNFKVILLAILFWPAIGICGPVLQWDASSCTNDCPTGYVVYYSDGETELSKKVLGLSIPLSSLRLKKEKSYTFRATAYNDAGESDYSNSVGFVTGRPTTKGACPGGGVVFK